MSEPLLTVDDLTICFGLATAVDHLSMHVDVGESVFVVGPNGAGKTTLLRSISALERPATGEMKLREKRLNGMNPWDIVRLGISHVPQNRRCFGPLTVEENLLMGGYTKKKGELPALLEAVYNIFPVLWEKRRQKSAELSGGQQQMVAIGRALMLDAHLIMLDEPSLGLAPMLVDNLAVVLRQIRDNFGTGILIVEQNGRVALSIGTRGYILQSGRVIGEGTPDELRGRLREALLGSELGPKRARRRGPGIDDAGR